MTNQQGVPEALRLADALECRTTSWPDKVFAAAELRRLHAENEALRTQQQECGNTPYDEGPFALEQPAPATQQVGEVPAGGETYHLGACIVDGVLYATMMRKERGCSGVATVLFSEQIPVEHLQDRDVIFHTTPPAQAADSVLEDAARLDWLALAGPVSICVVIDRPHDGEVEVATDDVTGYGKTLREALDAARKQGANHD